MEKQTPGSISHTYWKIEHDKPAEAVEGGMIEESLVSIYVNCRELATVMCSPLDQEALALGFIYNEGIIQSPDEVRVLKTNLSRTVVDVFLDRVEFTPPRRIILTSGCSGGTTFRQLTEAYPALESDFATTSDVIFQRMRDLKGESQLYNQVRGAHTAALVDEERVLVSAEDVGRHNTIDKIAGKALLNDVETRDRIILSTGRISSEMLNKARIMNIPLVASRTTPTSISVRLAQAWNICIVGYVRQNRMRVYTHPQRLGLSVKEQAVLEQAHG